MTNPKTLLELSGANLDPPRLASACLILIDMQNEYLEGPIAVVNAKDAVANASRILSRARTAAGTVIHVAHRGKPGGLFDRTAKRGQFIQQLATRDGETVVEKTLPNAFAGTSLQAQLEGMEIKELVLAGFMTHMCISSTARAALDLGFRVTIDADSCSTRDLPDGEGGTIDGESLHRAALVALSDRFAVITRNHDWR